MKNIKFMVFLSSIVLLILFLYISSFTEIFEEDQIAITESYENSYLGIEIIPQEQWDTIIQNKQKRNIETSFFINDVPIWGDKNYLISKSQNNITETSILSEEHNYKLYFSTVHTSKDSVFNILEPIPLLVVYNNKYDIKYFSLSNLPVIEFNTWRKAFIVHDNTSNTNLESTEYGIRSSKIRGGSSKTFPKKSYRIELKKKVSLLGMREDEDWILNAIYWDWSHMREKIGYDIWNDMSPINNHTLEYVELVMDGEYQGIYCLQEPVDQKTFNIDRNEDFLYSIFNYEREIITEHSVLNKHSGKPSIYSFEFEKSTPGTEQEYLRMASSINESFSGKEGQYPITYNIENFLQYNILINILSAMDNVYKNQKIAIDSNNGQYMISKSPWDLDISLLCEQVNKEWVDWTKIPEDVIISDHARDTALFETPEIKTIESEIYFSMRNTFLTPEYIEKKVQNYYNMLVSGGAVQRNNEKWNINEFEGSVETVLNYLKTRLQVLDKHYGSINGI